MIERWEKDRFATLVRRGEIRGVISLDTWPPEVYRMVPAGQISLYKLCPSTYLAYESFPMLEGKRECG